MRNRAKSIMVWFCNFIIPNISTLSTMYIYICSFKIYLRDCTNQYTGVGIPFTQSYIYISCVPKEFYWEM